MMIWVAAILAGGGALALLAWHMVRPNRRELRLSTARFLDDLPVTRQPRMRLRPMPPVGSVRFWLRMGAAGAVLAALLPVWPQMRVPAPRAVPLRIVLDLSPSMSVGDRMDQARAAVRILADGAGEGACVELFTPGDGQAPAGPEAFDARLAAARPGADGVAAAAFLGLPDRDGPCGGAAVRVAVVSDGPALRAGAGEATMLWWQVGEPAANLAVTDLRVTGGGLGRAEGTVVVTVQGYGPVPGVPVLSLSTPAGESALTMRSDPDRADGWLAEAPFAGAGLYAAALPEGGAWAGDDRMVAELTDRGHPAVDWQLARPTRPGRFAQGGAEAVLVADWTGAAPADRAAVLIYPAIGSTAQVGPFVQDHPLLEDISLDALERALPRGLEVLPEGLMMALSGQDAGPDGGARAILALRDRPRVAVIPGWTGAGDGAVLGRMLLANALRWVLEAEDGVQVAARHVDATGRAVGLALAESNTARPPAPPPDLRLLDAGIAAGPGRPVSGVPLWLLLAAALLLVERAVALRDAVRS